MGREHVAGAIILDRLRERMISGLYLGHWRAGDRLPSIREIADAENVDRKTAAAAYRRLEEEGLVRVRARSGVYLSAPARRHGGGPLERLYRRWLENTYDGARALGLDTRTILQLVSAIAELERLRLPVIECDHGQADALAAELRDRLGVRATPVVIGEIRADDPVLLEAAVLVTTPYHYYEMAAALPGRPIIEATLAPNLISELALRIDQGPLAIVAAEGPAVAKIRRALDHCGIAVDGERLRVVGVADRAGLADTARGSQTLFLWPGAPRWIEEALPASVERYRPRQSVSNDSLSRIRAAILDAAIRRVAEIEAGVPVSTSSVDAARL